MKHTVFFVCVVVTLLTFRPDAIEACSCVRGAKQEHARKWVGDFEGAVFRGKVTKIVVVRVPVVLPNRQPGYTEEREVTFVVEEIWKGPQGKEIKIRTGMGNGDCGVGYAQGKSYFVAADANSGKLYTGICSTVTLDMKTIAELGKGKVPR